MGRSRIVLAPTWTDEFSFNGHGRSGAFHLRTINQEALAESLEMKVVDLASLLGHQH
jgi:hypothetical protein